MELLISSKHVLGCKHVSDYQLTADQMKFSFTAYMHGFVHVEVGLHQTNLAVLEISNR